MELSLASGRLIHLRSIRQFPAAGRVLEGPGLDAAVLLRSLRARSSAGSGSFLAEPPDGWQDGRAGLPGIQCEADFESGPTAGSNDDYSSLTLIWFQVAFGFPPLAPYVLEGLRTVDWEHFAQNARF